ncbi:MAG: AzlC family ABC transporter permease [Alphaproteobacteria bacterium]
MTDQSFASPRAAWRGGVRDAFGMPALGLSAGFIGFGAMAREADLGVWVAMFSTISVWAGPAQVMMVEMYAAGASLAVILTGVAVVNMRFLPMSASLMPVLAEGQSRRWPLYLAAYYLAIMSWAYSMRRCPHMPHDQRLPYFVGFALTVMMVATPATGVGYVLAGHVPPEVTLGLIALPPIYLMLVFVDGVRDTIGRIALIVGAVIGPAFHLLDPNWGLMLTGLVAGTLAYAIDRRQRGKSRSSAAPGG